MAILQLPGNEENKQTVEAKDSEVGFTVEELNQYIGGMLSYAEIGQDYIMIFSRINQIRREGFNQVATKLTYNHYHDNMAVYGPVLFVEDSEISEELKVKE